MNSADRAVLWDITALVVDDHRDSVQLLIAALEPFGAAVIAAGSAPEAREVLSATKVDVIVCDLGLPGEDGLELIRWVRARPSRHDIPAIAVTFFSERFGVREARAAGYDVFLRKPIDPTDIVRVVATLVNRQRPPA
ncbi:MAG: response regulator [Candidatus Rokuibacteriota bacterium]|nr:MAG: response regulator [Candidatus Rokubacteria bacterium]